MGVLSTQSEQKVVDLNKARTKAYNALKMGIIEEIAKVLDETHAIKVNDQYNTFFNHCRNETEAVKYVTTDGEQLYLMSGEEECFFADDDYGEIHWDDFMWVLNSDEAEVVEIEWKKMF